MTTAMKIDFVSDVSCPWCIIGLLGLEQALERSSGAIDAEIVFRPFELNPAMPAGGQNIAEHVAQKYGSPPAQSAANRQMITDRAAELGFTMAMSGDSRIYNTFDAHRLLHWAEQAGHQTELKHALFTANFTEGKDPGNYDVLVEAAERAGLDGKAAAEVLSSGRYAEEVRQEAALWRSRGIDAVPAIVVNDRHLISGGQPVEVFETVLRRIAAEADDETDPRR